MTLAIPRRGLLGMLAAGAAAAIVRPGLLMPIKPQVLSAHEITQRAYEKIVNPPVFGEITFGAHPNPGDTITINGQVWTFARSSLSVDPPNAHSVFFRRAGAP